MRENTALALLVVAAVRPSPIRVVVVPQGTQGSVAAIRARDAFPIRQNLVMRQFVDDALRGLVHEILEGPRPCCLCMADLRGQRAVAHVRDIRGRTVLLGGCWLLQD